MKISLSLVDWLGITRLLIRPSHMRAALGRRAQRHLLHRATTALDGSGVARLRATPGVLGLHKEYMPELASMAR